MITNIVGAGGPTIAPPGEGGTVLEAKPPVTKRYQYEEQQARESRHDTNQNRIRRPTSKGAREAYNSQLAGNEK